MMRLNPKMTQVLAKALIWGSALLVIVLLLFILLFVLIKGLPTLSWQFLTENPRDMGRSGGIFSTIISTILVTLVSVAVATPFGVGTALYLTEFTREGLATRIIRFSADTLAAIPSIVYGLFGFIFFVINLNMGWSILSGGLTMAMMILPTIIRTAEEAILAIHPLYREVSFSLGGTKMQTILGAVLPSALRGIMTVSSCPSAVVSPRLRQSFSQLDRHSDYRNPFFHPPGPWRYTSTSWFARVSPWNVLTAQQRL
jgi:phosphate transport system permease protein